MADPMADLNVLELYAGIGGCAAALAGTTAQVVAAVEQSRVALGVYGANFPTHRQLAHRVDDLAPDTLAALEADLWWASPPCQPFTVRGRRRDLDDPRAQTFLALLRHLEAVRPPAFALENVVGFVGSSAHARLLETLERCGYTTVREHQLCPSALGQPNRRPRVYVLAARGPLEPFAPTARPRRLQDLLDPSADDDPSLHLDPAVARKYAGALHVVDTDTITNCFTAAYGRSPVRSGSYLRLAGSRPDQLRRFSPAEVLRLLGFPADFVLPSTLPRRKAWHLAGNSLSVPAVRAVLGQLPALADVLIS